MTNQAIAKWEVPWLDLPIHDLIAHQIQLGVAGVESALLVGPPGVGKSDSVDRFVKQYEAIALQRALSTGESLPKILHYTTSVARGPKTVLVDLYDRLHPQALSKRARQDWTPTTFVRQIALEAQQEQVCLICIDEAQMIDAANIDLLRQVPDAARQLEHSVRLFLIGYDSLRQTVAATGQLGERFPTVLRHPVVAASDLSARWHELHPALGTLRTSLPKREWQTLERDLLARTAGSMRRLATVIQNAHVLASLHAGGAPVSQVEFTPEIVRFALDKLAECDAP